MSASTSSRQVASLTSGRKVTVPSGAVHTSEAFPIYFVLVLRFLILFSTLESYAGADMMSYSVMMTSNVKCTSQTLPLCHVCVGDLQLLGLKQLPASPFPAVMSISLLSKVSISHSSVFRPSASKLSFCSKQNGYTRTSISSVFSQEFYSPLLHVSAPESYVHAYNITVPSMLMAPEIRPSLNPSGIPGANPQPASAPSRIPSVPTIPTISPPEAPPLAPSPAEFPATSIPELSPGYTPVEVPSIVPPSFTPSPTPSIPIPNTPPITPPGTPDPSPMPEAVPIPPPGKPEPISPPQMPPTTPPEVSPLSPPELPATTPPYPAPPPPEISPPTTSELSFSSSVVQSLFEI